MAAVLTAHKVRFGYGQKTVIDDISLDFESGCFYGVIGPNGCGKTTLIDLLIGSLKPQSGRIRYQERVLGSYSRRALAREMALVPQNFYVNFPFTAREVVLMGRYPYIPRFGGPSETDGEVVARVMADTDLEPLANRPVTQLSGGERQRVIFARALVQQTPVLLLDEATSNLDTHHTLQLLNLVASRIRSGVLVLAVFQDINLAALYCDRLVFMQNGAIVTYGPTQEVLTRHTIQDVFQVDSKVYFEPFAEALQVVFKR